MLGLLAVFVGFICFAISGYQNFDYFDYATKKKLSYNFSNSIVIIPRLTEAAYSDHGFYWYYDGRCGTECLSVPVDATGEQSRYGSYNYNTVKILTSLGYPMVTDLTVHTKLLVNPDYLDQYDNIILLHNEYVTRQLFDAITQHKNVIHLHPNALYAEVQVLDDKITLIKGHGYPTKDIDNGFEWEYDNTRPDEFDIKCDSWQFKRISNGYQLNCYPEVVLTQKPEILAKLKELTQ